MTCGCIGEPSIIMRAVSIRQEEKNHPGIIKARQYCRDYLQRVVLQVRCQGIIDNPSLNFHTVKGHPGRRNLYVSTWWPASDTRGYKVRIYLCTVDQDFNVRKDVTDQVADFARFTMIQRLQEKYDKTYAITTVDQYEYQS